MPKKRNPKAVAAFHAALVPKQAQRKARRASQSHNRHARRHRSVVRWYADKLLDELEAVEKDAGTGEPTERL